MEQLELPHCLIQGTGTISNLTGGNLLQRFNETNFYLIPVMWDKTHGFNIQGL